ncbi:MAG: ABC transporter ATP-binding protein [Actinomycetota bacterium]
MKTQARRERVFSPVGVEARYPAPKAWVHADATRGWIRRMLPVAWSHRASFLTAWIATLVSVLIGLASPAVVREAVNALTAGNIGPVRTYVVVLCGLAVGRFLIGFVSRYFMLTSAYGIEYDHRAIIYEHLTRMSFAFYDKVQSGQLISRANSDIRSVQMFLAFAPTMFIQFLTFFIALAFMLSIHPLLTLVAILPLPGVWWVGMRMRQYMFPISWIVQARAAEVATIVDENVTGVRIVKSFTAELQQIRELAKAARRVQWANVKQVDVRARFSPILENLPRAALVFVLFYGGYLVTQGELDLGAILFFMGYIVLLTAPFRILGFMLMLSQRARASAGRIYEILDTHPDVQDRPGAVDLLEPNGDVEFRGVTFGYSHGPSILEDFSLHLGPGEVVALVGRTGCGKSTVARLLMRFYDVTDGAVVVDGYDARDLTQESLRSHIGLVADDAFLFSDSIRNNIAYGRPDAPMDDIVGAAKAAGAHDFVERLPDGYDTVIGERGYDLSGGQRQRVSIARLLVTDPAILILDDATSSVDVHIEQEIHDSLRRVMEQRTTLVIAHRLSTINLSDRVVLMERGRIIASGTHAELMRSEPRYTEVLAHLEEDEAALHERSAGKGHALRDGLDVEGEPTDWSVQ